MVSSAKKYTSKAICRYCGDSRPVCYMTMVPMNAERLSRWIDILGPLFAANIQQFKCNFICRNHLNSPKRSPNRLPVPMQNGFSPLGGEDVKVKKELEEEIFQENEEQYDDCVVMLPPKREVLDEEEMRTKQRIDLEPEVQYIHTSNDNTQKNGVKTSKKANKHLYKKVCRYCGASCPQSEMTCAPSNPDRLSEWIDILGPEFAQNVRRFKTLFICRKHLSSIREALAQLHRKTKNNVRMVEEKIEEDDEEVIEDLPQKMEDRNDDDVELLHRQPETLEIEKDGNQHFTCRVCGVRGDEKMMTPVPRTPKSLHKWANILGSVFFGNILQNSAPHFVCMSHLRTIVEELCQE